MRWLGNGRWVSAELSFIAALRQFATHPAARGLNDDAAVLEIGGARLIITHDSLVEGVHYLHSDPPESVAWKLLAVNLSDLAAKGGSPRGAMMSYTLRGDADWDARFAAGLGAALAHFDVALLGGDTVSAPSRVLGLTLIGEASGPVPARSGAHAGDALFVTGVIGDAGLGLDIARGLANGDATLLAAYQRPQPQMTAGALLAPVVTAMMDVSDGLLIDAGRLATASGLCAVIDLDAVPLSPAFRQNAGEAREARLRAATAGDDYQLLFTSALPLPALPVPVTRIGKMTVGQGMILTDQDGALPLPEKLGWLHGLP
jgi:thiamine-monophosphate kinase